MNQIWIKPYLGGYLDESRGVYIMKSMHLKSEIAQLELSDLCRKPSVG